MLRLGPTRIFLGEEDLRYHLERIYLHQTEYAAEYNMDHTDSDEDDDEDGDGDEDDEVSVDSQPFSSYALTQLKGSDIDYTSEPDSWTSPERWSKNWTMNAVSLSATLARPVTLETSLPQCVELVSSVGADQRAHDVKGALTQRANKQPRHHCYTASPPHSPNTDTLTPTSRQSEPQVFRELPPNIVDERIRRCFKSPKTYTTRHLSLSFPHELGGSTDFSVSFPFPTLTLTLQHTPSQRRQHQAASPRITTRPSQQNKLRLNLSTETYPSTYSAKLNPLVRILIRALQERQKVKAIIMDRARDPSNSGPWRRGIRTRNPAWRLILGDPPFHETGAEQGPQMSPADPARDPQHLSGAAATAESPSRPDFQRASNESIIDEVDRMYYATPLGSSAIAIGNVEISPRQATRPSDADANRFSGFLPSMRVLDPVGNTAGPARLTPDGEAPQDHAAFPGPPSFLPVMEPPLRSPLWASSAPENYRIFTLPREHHVPTATYRPAEAISEVYPSLAAGERYDFPAIDREQSATTHSPVEAIPQTSPSLAAGERYGIPAIAREQLTTTHSPVEAIPQASPAVRVQPFTPVNPPSRTRQEGSATPHGSHPEPNHNDEAEAKLRTAVCSIERRLKRMMADEFREPESIRIVDYGLGALRRKPLGEWYREAVNKDE